MRSILFAVVATGVGSAIAHAEAPGSSPVPRQNPAFAASAPTIAVAQGAATVASKASFRPRRRPDAPSTVGSAGSPAPDAVAPASIVAEGTPDVQIATASTIHPKPRPDAALPAEATAEQAPDNATPEVQVATAKTIHPQPRPGNTGVAALAPPSVQVATAQTVHPQPRPAALGAMAVSNVVALSTSNMVSSPRPMAMPQPQAQAPQQTFLQTIGFVRTPPLQSTTRGTAGSVCGDPQIIGQTIPPISSRVHGCGISDPVRVTSIAGIKLSEPATVECGTAVALKKWITGGLEPAVGTTGGGVKEITVFGTYECRPRNNQHGAEVSLHGQGKAIDIGGFVLANGQAVTVAKDWRDGFAKIIQTAYHAACGTFGTTLGPGSDGFHENHMHFDTAHYSYGAYCH